MNNLTFNHWKSTQGTRVCSSKHGQWQTPVTKNKVGKFQGNISTSINPPKFKKAKIKLFLNFFKL